MPEEMAARVAEAAEVIVNGYALMKHDLGVRISSSLTTRIMPSRVVLHVLQASS